MALYNIKNENPGARGVGDFLVDAGEAALAVELTEDEALLLGEFDGVTVKEARAESKPEPKAKTDESK